MGTQRNIRLVMEYDGGGYHGWQVQPDALTIQHVLEDRIARITQNHSRLVAAGRTDAGVHALQQVANFHTPSEIPLTVLQRGLNAILPHDIRVLHVDELPWEFNARYSALAKRYEYRLWNDRIESVFQHRYAWWIPFPLDVEAMKSAARALLGTHDFTSFRSAQCDGKNAVREIKGCGWKREGPLLVFWIEANGFLRHMIRAIIGTLVEVGAKKRSAEQMGEILRARDRSRAGITAPARGLFLTAVTYPDPWRLDTDAGVKGLFRFQAGAGEAPEKETSSDSF